MYKIIEGIYQGGIPSEGLPENVEAVVSLNDRVPRMPQIKAHLIMTVEDGEFPGVPWLETVVACIHAFRQKGMAVYIHCQAGISRSTMVTAAYLMKHKGLTYSQAVDKVGSANPHTSPNPRFILGLKDWEQRHLSS